MALKEYVRKRDFKKTAEPRGRIETKPSSHRFVIQKHDASRLHYDFRLEMDGVLKSWAVPKGPPYSKADKRLAVEVEDHPVSYIDFEGTIPKGQYGGGTVMVWDRGTFEATSETPEKDLAGGKLHFQLHGKKLNGEWYLVRLKDEKQWLLIKAGESMKPISAKQDDTSAISGKSMKQLSRSGQVWESNRASQEQPELVQPPAKAPAGKASAKSKGAELEVDGVKMKVSNLGKIYYPKTGFTKGNVIDYYIRISPFLLPHLKNRPITLKRYPEGVEGFFFYEKQCPANKPEWMNTTDVPRSDGSIIHYCLVDTLPSLVWAANMSDLELHTFLHRTPAIARPTILAFDLDPGPPADIVLCSTVGLRLKALFDSLKLKCFAKTSGSKGLQVYVPLNTPAAYKQTKSFAREVAAALEREFPEMVLQKMQRDLRKGKVFVDWSQNDDHKTTVSVYSLRAREHPTVSTPVTWDEVAAAAKKNDAKRLVFETEDVLKRVEKDGDLFAEVQTLKQKLPNINANEMSF